MVLCPHISPSPPPLAAAVSVGPTPVSLPGKSRGLRSLVGYSPLGYKELDTTEHSSCLVLPSPHHASRCCIFFTNWTIMSTLPWAHLLVPFSQQYLLTSCFCVTFWQVSQYFTRFHYCCVCYSDLWSVIFDVTIATHWGFKWWLVVFGSKAF